MPVIYAFSGILRQVRLPTPSAPHDLSKGLAILAFTAIVIRLELAPLTLAVAAVLYSQNALSFSRTVLSGLVGGSIGLSESISSPYTDQQYLA